MKKIILSVAVATMALSTTASALEDIKVSGDAKVWYETNNKGDNGIFERTPSTAEVVFKLGMTGKQGDVGFGAEITQGSTMGLENVLVMGTRTNANTLTQQLDSAGVAAGNNGNSMYVSKAYFTAPVAPDTIVKMGRQELNTPLAFTEKWNAQQNNFDAAVFINSSVTDLTLIAAYVGQTNTAISSGTPAWKAQSNFEQLHGGAFAAGALYAKDAINANLWVYSVNDYNNANILGKVTAAPAAQIHAEAVWVDASYKMGDMLKIKAVAAMMAPSDNLDSTTGFALCANTKVAGWDLSAAGSMVGEGVLPIANVATNFKKTKLPTAGVYTDGLYVAQPESTAFKVKAAGKVGSTGLALQAVNNSNDADATKDTTEIDLIVSQKLGVFNLKGIIMHRMFSDDATDDAAGGQYVRAIASVKF